MQPKEQKLQLLSALAAEFNRQNITWAVGASLLLYLRGYVEDFHDIDLMVTAADAAAMEEILRAHGKLQPSENGNYATKCFREFVIDGIDVDMIGGFAIIRDGKVYDCDLYPSQISGYADVYGQKIPLHSVDLWKTYYLLMGRDEKAAILDRKASLC